MSLLSAVSIRLGMPTGRRQVFDIPIHVGCGRVAAFLRSLSASPDLPLGLSFAKGPFDQLLSGHKFGLAPLGAAWSLWRTAGGLPEQECLLGELSRGNNRDYCA